MIRNGLSGTRDGSSILGLRRSSGVGIGNPLQYSCLENSIDRNLVGYSPWGHRDLDMTEPLNPVV